VKVVLTSDTHGFHDAIDVPDGDLLIVAGDFTKRGRREEIAAFDRWLRARPHRHKVVIAGNHDFGMQDLPDRRGLITGATYLEDELVEIGGVRIWGSPWQPRFFDWAFNLDRGEPLRRVWAKIPDGIDILVTHGPPRGILDVTDRGEAVGCDDLREAVFRVRPKLHVFGHIHEAYGERMVDGVRFVNACACTVRYAPTQPPIVVTLRAEPTCPA
jgi:Icc-related predicted phosphoesterase